MMKALTKAVDDATSVVVIVGTEARFRMLSKEQRVFIIKQFYKTDSVSKVRQLYLKAFKLRAGDRNVPSRFTIRRLVKKFEKECSVKPGRKAGIQYRTGKNEKARIVKDLVAEEPFTSVRRLSSATGYSKSCVQRLLSKELGLKPYRLQMLQRLKESDYEKRVTFARAVLQRGEQFSKTIVFSDESSFYLNGKVSTHNVRIWGSERPSIFVEHERNCPKVNVFCAMSTNQIFGPYFFNEDTIKSDEYLDMLRHWCLPQLPDDIIFMQDGAPPHWALVVRAYLNAHFPQQWIGRAADRDDALIRWPPRSPDLTPCDFFLWGYIKGKVFYPPMPQTVEQMKARIRLAIGTITGPLLLKVWGNFDRRLVKVIDQNGHHFEHMRF